jgi:hypothetical protein
MNDVILFAVFADNETVFNETVENIKTLEQHFPDSNVYVGINPCSFVNQLIEAFNNSKLKVKIGITPNNLIINSDASAFQTALKLFKNDKQNYKTAWFFHSKPGNAKHFIGYLIEKKQKIQKLFDDNEKIGAFGRKLLLINLYPEKSGVAKLLDKYYNFCAEAHEYFYEATFFCIKSHILENFIYNCNNSFFEEKLSSPHEPNGDRYFFERDFIHIVDRQGYLLSSFINEIVSDGRYPQIRNLDQEVIYRQQIKKWAEDQKIFITEKCLNEIFLKD